MTTKAEKATKEKKKTGDPGPTPVAEAKAEEAGRIVTEMLASEGKEGLHTRLARVLAKIGKIPKSGRNEFHGYDYVVEDDLTEQIRPMLADEGISLIFAAEEIVLEDNCIAHVRCTFTLGCDIGEPITTTVWGAGRDADRNGKRGDKAVYKAMTGATKYFLYKTFLVSTGDDVEIEPPAGDAGLRMTPGQLKELEKFNRHVGLNDEVKKYIERAIGEGGSQAAAARILAEAKRQIKAYEAKQKEELDQEKPDEPGREPADQHPREDPMRGGETGEINEDDIPF